MKKMLIIIFTLLSVFLITYFFKDDSKKILILSKQTVTSNTFGYYVIDYLKEKELLKEEYIYQDNSINPMNIINIIDENILIKDKTIQNLLVKVDYLLIQLEDTTNLNKLIELLRKYCKERIIIVCNQSINISKQYDVNIIFYEDFNLQTNKIIANQIIHNML